MERINRLLKSLAARSSRRSRERKLDWLRRNIDPGSSVLVVGAAIPRSDGLGIDNIVERGIGYFARLHALTYDDGDPLLGCGVTRGDACRLPFADGSFDYVFSNAVIEHVGGPERARAMLSESVRVARRAAFHTTPNRWFPIEVHTLVPFAHWLPRPWQSAVFRRLGKPHWRISYYWLYGKRDLARLDPRFRVQRSSPVTLIATWRRASGGQRRITLGHRGLGRHA